MELCNEIIDRYSILKETEDYIFKFKTNSKKILINADKKKIEQVIYNLVGNAINYTSDKKKIYVNIIEKKNQIRVSISDIGKGINQKDLKNIWDKYYKSDKNHKRNTIGTGLGLSIVKRILELHNYQYGVITKKNKGTTFYFYINK